MDNIDSVDSMLRNTSPGVDPRFRSDRKGNPLEQAIAVAQGGLSEAEVFNLVNNAGVSKEFVNLPDKLKSIVIDGLSGLWKIDRLGRDVERKDKEVVGSAAEMKHVVEENSESIKRSHHGAVMEWLPHSTNSLVKAAIEKDAEKRRMYKDGVMSPPDGYVRKLNSVSYDYKERKSNIQDQSKREGVGAYLTGTRDSDLGAMRSIIFQRVGMVVAAIEPTSEKTK